MPRPSPCHVWGAVFTADFFLLLTVQARTAAAVSGVLGVYCVLQRGWFVDRPPPQKDVDIGAEFRAPTYAGGPSSHGWWAMAITPVVAGMSWR